MKHDEDDEVERIAVSCREALAGRQALLGMKKVEVLEEKRKGGLKNGSSRPWHEGSPSFAARGKGGDAEEGSQEDKDLYKLKGSGAKFPIKINGSVINTNSV